MKKSIIDVTTPDAELIQKYADYTPQFIIHGLIKMFGKNIFAAERGSGKTRLMLFLAYAIVYECKEVLGYKINTWGDVLYLNLEISERDFKAFIQPIINCFEKKLGLKKVHNLYITSLKESANKLNDVKLIVDRYKPLLTIIDSYKLYQAMICMEENQREINNSNFEKVLRLLDELILEFNTTIALINHTNKDTRDKSSNADLMYGPGALPDFCDQVTLIRKTRIDNKRLIVPDKSRYCADGFITTNLVEIKSTDDSSTNPDQLYFELVEENVSEADYLPRLNARRIPEEIKNAIINYVVNDGGTQADAAERFLGSRGLKGTVSKIIAEYYRKLRNRGEFPS